MELDNRKKRILQAIVNEYVDTIEPVSSNSLIKKYGLDCSSATVRNEMAELEKAGFLEKTHTSSGRIPSNKGYRFYVDELANYNDLNINEIKYINSQLQCKVNEMEELTKITTNTISEVTHYTTMAVGPNVMKQKIQEIKFVLLGSRLLMAVILTEAGTIKETIIKFDEDISQEQVDTLTLIFNNQLRGKALSTIDAPLEQYIMNEVNYRIDVIKPVIEQINKALSQESKFYLNGANKALDNPELKTAENAKKFLEILEEKNLISDLLDKDNGLDLCNGDVKVYIGNEINGLSGFSLITFKNTLNGKNIGNIGIIGPTRMDYSKVISVLNYIKNRLNGK